MKIKALITTLAILGTSSIAMARPVTTSSASAQVSWSFGTPQPAVRTYRPLPTPTPVVRDHRTPATPVYHSSDRYSDRYSDRLDWNRDGGWNHQPRMIMLGENLSFFNTENRKDIVVDASVGPLTKLIVTAEGGRTFIKHIGIEFTSGATQEIPLNVTISRDDQMAFDIDRSKGKIFRVFVYRADGESARYMNTRHRGAFTVTAL